MIIVRAPLRITFGGGGTDLIAYSSKHEGFCVSAAISKYCYVAINHSFKEGINLKYSDVEKVKYIDEVKHPIFREALNLIGLKTPQVEIVSIADVPSDGSGLGNSGAFTVALLKSLFSYKSIQKSATDIANYACKINIDILKKTQGKQDEYISSLGGIGCLTFKMSGEVEYEPLNISHDTLIDLEENLLLFYTGANHDTESILKHQEIRTKEEDVNMLYNLTETKNVGIYAQYLLERGRTKDFGKLLDDQWELKERRMPAHNYVLQEDHIGFGNNGALGSKLVGSGMGGFFLVYAENKNKVRQYARGRGLEELRFNFDFEGAKRMV